MWTDDFVEELNRRCFELENGKVKGYSWEEVKARAREKRKSTMSNVKTNGNTVKKYHK